MYSMFEIKKDPHSEYYIFIFCTKYTHFWGGGSQPQATFLSPPKLRSNISLLLLMSTKFCKRNVICGAKFLLELCFPQCLTM